MPGQCHGPTVTCMTPASRLVDAAIQHYQERLSPRKGWGCAHRVAHGGPSCSAAVRDIVRRRGVVRGVRPTVLRFVACYQAASLLMASDVRGVCCCGPIPIPFRF
jgi:putative component of membrane protein insertase Oxa1/YidC/SpoIIIJ protein YidD